MECSSMFFPIQVKQEIIDDSYDAPQGSLADYYSSAAHYGSQALPQPLPPIHIKREPGLNESLESIGHHGTPNLDGEPSRSSPLANASVPIPMVSSTSGGIPPPQPVVDSPPNGATPYAGHPDSMSIGMVPSPATMTSNGPGLLQQSGSMVSSKPSKKKKKKIKQEPMADIMPPSQMSMVGTGVMKKKLKQEKIPDTFKVRKKVDRFNGMPEEEVVKRTLPDHLTTDLDIVIIGINPGMFAAFKGHHYAGPGNHFWKCLYLSGLIPEPMTADDDFRLIEYGIGFTNIVARTTRGSADLARKEIREGAQILQEKMQKYRPKIAVFNGKGIYEVFSGRKNFDFGKQPEPIEGTNTIIYVMPSSSARCAQLPRAVDKVPFYVALRKLRDHLCGRLPLLRDAEVCFPDVKLKIEGTSDEPSIKMEPGDEDGADLNYSGNSSMFEGPLSGPRTALLQSQRNFHQHPLGRAALAAAAAAGGYLEVSLARAGFTGATPPGRSSKHCSSLARDAKKKSSSSSKKKKKKSDFGNQSGSGCDSETEMRKKVKMEPPDGDVPGLGRTDHGGNENGSCESPNQHLQQHHPGGLCGSPLPSEYRSPTPKHTPPAQHVQRPTPHPHPLSAYGTLSSSTYQGQMSPSPSLPTDRPPLYSSPVGPTYHPHHQAPLHIKQEKMDPMDASRLGSPSPSLNSAGAVSPSLLSGYPSPVGCLYGPSGSASGNYGTGPPQSPSPYFSSPPPQNPYSPYSSLNPLLPLGHHHHHHSHQLGPSQGGPNHSTAAELYASTNGLHHHHHLQSMGAAHESQYFGVAGQSGGGVNGSPYSPHMSHKDASPPTSVATAFHQYPSPSSAYHHQHSHLHQSPNGAPPQYCPPPPLPDAGAVQNPTAITGVYDNQAASPAPLYTNLENVKVKQERLDPTYGEY